MEAEKIGEILIQDHEMPILSVVMGVYNGAEDLDITIDSVLAQPGVHLEFIVVDDGSTDDTPEILRRRSALDARLKIITQCRNFGLTEALARGCSVAQGKFIARQDCGDRSLPGRFAAQLSFLDENRDVVATACGTRYIAPCGAEMYTVVQEDDEWYIGTQCTNVNSLVGPSHHGATMFRRKIYEHVGGYRPVFKVAQDIDLWLRLSEKGKLMTMPDILYEAGVRTGSISADNRAHQFLFGAYAIECAKARRGVGTDLHVPMPKLRRKKAVSLIVRRVQESQFNYFIGSTLLRNNPVAAKSYLRKSLLGNPLNIRAWLKIMGVAG